MDYIGYALGGPGQIGNTALGNYAFQGHVGGTNSVAVGFYSGRLLNCYLASTKSNNMTLVGANIGYDGLGNATDSVFVGTGILYNSGSYTTVSGDIQTTSTLSTVNYATVVGSQALQYATSGCHVIMGYNALNQLTSGLHATAFGYQAALNLATGGYNVHLGDNVAAAAYAGSNNIVIGGSAQSFGVIAMGTVAGSVLTIATGGFINGGGNLTVGATITMAGLTAGTTITSFGTGTGGVGTYNLSTSATISTATVFTTRDWTNTIAIGNGAEPTASNQVYIGNNSTNTVLIGGTTAPLVNISSGINGNNNAVGNNTLTAITTCIENNAFGYGALKIVTYGSYNSAFGHAALNAGVSIADCSAFGSQALTAATGGRNTAIGSQAGINVIAGHNNLFAGAYCGTGNIVGNNNVILGDGANTQVAGFDCSNAIIIGQGIQATASNQIIIGNSAQSVSLGGTLTIATGAAGAAVFAGSLAAASFVGQTGGTAMVAGSIGEVISSNVAGGSAISLTTATAANITSITLTAGDWEVSGNITLQPSAAMTVLAGAVSGTAATLPAWPASGAGSKVSLLAAWTSGANQAFVVGTERFLITPAMVSGGTNIVYLVTSATFASGTCTAYGYIKARRAS